MQVVLQKDIKDVEFRNLIFYNLKLHPKEKMYCDCTDCTYQPKVDENGFHVFRLPVDDCRQKLRHKSDRWRIYNDKPLDVKMKRPNGSFYWETVNPYSYKINTVYDGLKDNGEQKLKKKVFWKEIVVKPEELVDGGIEKEPVLAQEKTIVAPQTEVVKKNF